MQRTQDHKQKNQQKKQHNDPKMGYSSTKNHEYYYNNFVDQFKSAKTKVQHRTQIKYFMDYLGIPRGNYADLLGSSLGGAHGVGGLMDEKTLEIHLKGYLKYLRNEKSLSYETAKHYLNSVKAFYEENSDFYGLVNWKRIKRHLGDDDGPPPIEGTIRPYTLEEIQIMLSTAEDNRTKIIILLMASTGMRIDAVADLVKGDFTRTKDGERYQIRVYANSKKHVYTSFCSKECAEMIDFYLKSREHAGEIIQATSPLLRRQYNPKDSLSVRNPRPIGTGNVKYLINEVLTKDSALRPKLEWDYENKRKVGRHQTSMSHSFRKFFITEAHSGGMSSEWIDMLTDHKLPGVRGVYIIPPPEALLEGTPDRHGYKHIEPRLTINSVERERLEKVELAKRIQSQEDVKFQVQSLQEQLLSIEEKFNLAEEYGQRARTLNREVESLDFANPNERKIKYQKFDEYLEARKKHIKQENELYRTLEKKYKNKIKK